LDSSKTFAVVNFIIFPIKNIYNRELNATITITNNNQPFIFCEEMHFSVQVVCYAFIDEKFWLPFSTCTLANLDQTATNAKESYRENIIA
jgi:hypothetical protein